MKLNQEKVREALRISESLQEECTTLMKGIDIAINVFSSGIFSWMLKKKCNILYNATRTCRKILFALNAFKIEKGIAGYSLWYDGMVINSLEEYIRCRKMFKRDFCNSLFSESKAEEYWKTLGEDYRLKFSEQITSFLDKLEEAFKD